MSNNLINSKSCMIYPMVPFAVTLSDLNLDFKVTGFIIDALGVLCALMRDLFAIAKFLLFL